MIVMVKDKMNKIKLTDLIELANQIKDRELRQKTIEVLRDPKPSNDWKIQPADLESVPSWLSGHHSGEGGLAQHTKSMTELAIEITKTLQKNGTKVNMDHVICASLLHDLGKLYKMERAGKGWKFTNVDLEHDILGAAELYARGFPEPVVKAVATHGGEVQANPTTVEGLIVHHADVLDSAAYNMGRPSKQVIYLTGEDILASFQS